MRRKRYQRGSVSVRKRGGRNYWLAQWREGGSSTTKELGPCSSISQGEARALLAEIVRPINEAAGGRAVDVYHTLKSFIKGVYLPVYTGRWKHSTASTETDRIRQQILPALGDCSIRELTREQMQSFLNAKAKLVSRSTVDHL